MTLSDLIQDLYLNQLRSYKPATKVSRALVRPVSCDSVEEEREADDGDRVRLCNRFGGYCS